MNQAQWFCSLQCLLLVVAHLCCLSCDRGQTLAKLESKQGVVERDRAGAEKPWQNAEIGASFGAGDAIRTAVAATASLRLLGGGSLTVKQESMVRFLSRRPDSKAKNFVLELGQALVEAGDRELVFTTELGQARLEANGRMLIRRTDRGVHFDVTMGQARFDSAEETRELRQGQAYVMSVGRAYFESAPRGDAGSGAVDAVVVPSASVEPQPAPVSTDPSGVVARVVGAGVTQQGPGESRYTHVAPGSAVLAHGAKVRIDGNSTVELERGGARLILAGPGDYRLSQDDGQVELHQGRISVSGSTRIVVPGGVIQTKDDAAATLDTPERNRTRVRVARGSVTVSGKNDSTEVAVGEEGSLRGDGSTKLTGRSLTYSDITVHAGESLTIHDPTPPTAVRFQFDAHCPTSGTIRIGSKAESLFASGHGSAVLGFGPGRHEYALHCLGDHDVVATSVARGTIIVLRDSGTRPVPASPPSSSVAVDGRSYNIMYQNQLPNVTVTWPSAPQTSSFRVFVESRGGAKVFASNAPRYSFRSGDLPEGRHSIYFEGAGKSSRHTEIAVSYDNAAPTASIVTPVDFESNATGEITLAGVAQPGWQVEIGGSPVSQDEQRRFSQRLISPSAERAVAVKLVHPTRGIHVYLRRLGRSSD